MADNAERNLRLFRELITCTHNLYSWSYDSRFSLTFTNCPDADILGMLFVSMTDQIPKDDDRPVLLFSPLGFCWAVNLERDGTGLPLYYHVIGPVVASQTEISKAREQILARIGGTYSMVITVDELLSRIPSVPIQRLGEYCLMLHYCICGDKLMISDILYIGTTPPRDQEGQTANPYGTWLMENRLLQLVEDGNLHFREEANRLVGGIIPADLGNGSVERHYKNLVIAFIASCTRAAIRGGVLPETAYFLSDRYIRSVEACVNMSELAELNDAMQEDFIRRVHEAKVSGRSPQIQRVCDYVQIHVEDELSLSMVSNAIGYSPAWLSSKFKKEAGRSLTRYILEQRVERAKNLLRSSNCPIQEIAETLHFKSPSHFGAVFRKYTGMSPGAYRGGEEL